MCCFCDAPLGALGRRPPRAPSCRSHRINLAVEPEARGSPGCRARRPRRRRRRHCKRIFLSRPILPTHRSPLPQERRLLRRRHPRSSSCARRNVTSDSRYRSPSWSLLPLPITPSGRFAINFAPCAPACRGVPPGTAQGRDCGRGTAAVQLRRHGSALGGHVGFNKLDLTVVGATFALFYAQYFALFTVFGGSTPGMTRSRLAGSRLLSMRPLLRARWFGEVLDI